ncbi:hypothetical protein QV08_11045 [Gallibacterium salpingitidis]|uniref:YihY/virulence factor BrkB family protein n=1 Tax=Gallibacterium salpingitidis TaxID=505341 RepID=UPI000805A2C4|nr:YihY/virulence factor BrkB family protein [Gallibacterium salpingitidis]OBX06112.1 hypothetical protein QV08_11045 [Gallibacterium salpingitidis]
MSKYPVLFSSYLTIFFNWIKRYPLQLYATSLTYYTLLTMVPLLSLLLWVLEGLGIDALFHTVMHGFLDPMGKIGDDVGSKVFDFVHNTHSMLLGSVGVLIFFGSIFILVDKIEKYVNQLWQITTSYPLKKKLRRYLIGFIFVLVLSLFVQVFENVIGNWLRASTATVFGVKLPSLVFPIIDFVFSICFLSLLFKTLPHRDVTIKSSVIAALFCLLLWSPITFIFHQVVKFNDTYFVVYHDFVGVMITLIWINILWLFFLLAVCLCRLIEENKLRTK